VRPSAREVELVVVDIRYRRTGMTRTVRVQPRLWRIYRRMNLAALTEEESEDGDPLGLESLEGRTRLAWETYSRGGLEHALRAYGTLERLEARGLGKLSVSLDRSDPYLRRSWSAATSSPRRGRGLPAPGERAPARPGRSVGDSPLLFLECSCCRTRASSSTGTGHRCRPAVPGLNLSGEAIQLLLLMAKRVRRGGDGAAPESPSTRRGLCAALPVRGRRRPGPLRGAPRGIRACDRSGSSPGPGAGLCTVRCRTRDVDAGSDDRATGCTAWPGQ
jgi:hypothetical protein